MSRFFWAEQDHAGSGFGTNEATDKTRDSVWTLPSMTFGSDQEPKPLWKFKHRRKVSSQNISSSCLRCLTGDKFSFGVSTGTTENQSNAGEQAGGKLLKLSEDNFVKLVSWYDNEWGYSNRLGMLGAKADGSKIPSVDPGSMQRFYTF